MANTQTETLRNLSNCFEEIRAEVRELKKTVPEGLSKVQQDVEEMRGTIENIQESQKLIASVFDLEDDLKKTIKDLDDLRSPKGATASPGGIVKGKIERFEAMIASSPKSPASFDFSKIKSPLK